MFPPRRFARAGKESLNLVSHLYKKTKFLKELVYYEDQLLP